MHSAPKRLLLHVVFLATFEESTGCSRPSSTHPFALPNKVNGVLERAATMMICAFNPVLKNPWLAHHCVLLEEFPPSTKPWDTGFCVTCSQPVFVSPNLAPHPPLMDTRE